jgi:hypothetical protein
MLLVTLELTRNSPPSSRGRQAGFISLQLEQCIIAFPLYPVDVFCTCLIIRGTLILDFRDDPFLTERCGGGSKWSVLVLARIHVVSCHVLGIGIGSGCHECTTECLGRIIREYQGTGSMRDTPPSLDSSGCTRTRTVSRAYSAGRRYPRVATPPNDRGRGLLTLIRSGAECSDPCSPGL